VEAFQSFDKRRLERHARWLRELRAWRNARVAPVPAWTFTGGDGVDLPLTVGDRWPSVDTPVRLRATAQVPKSWKGEPVELELWLGGEGFVSLTPGYQSGLNPFHHDFRITDKASGAETIEIEAEVVPKGMFGAHVASPGIDRAMLTIPHRPVRDLETDLTMLVGAAGQLQDHDVFSHLLGLVDAAYRELAPTWPSGTEIAKVRYISGDADGGAHRDFGSGDYGHPGFRGTLVVDGIWHIPPPEGSFEPLSQEALAACDSARAVIASGLDELKQRYPPVGSLLLTGHAHIDLAWLWPVAETRRKARRTFSSVLQLMDEFEDFTFNQSSAQVYAWLEEDDPELLERITERVKEGRWEPTGGMWVEPDSQVTGSEAYVRQVFYGQRYFQQRFGIRNDTAWLPDVFGFSGGIPQVLLGAGISKFFTIKVTWSESNPFPVDLFWWEGIDGSRVMAHTFYNPGAGYNGDIVPLDTIGTWRGFKGKRLHDQTLLSFGWGDGGGGPDRRMLENYARIKDYPVLPRLQMGKVEDFFANLPTEGVPAFTGELYLELHRATLTTQGLVKKLNRESEHRLVEAEAFAALASLPGARKGLLRGRQPGAQYPHERLDTNWKSLLLNQFHDILPGSSINEVYQDTHPELRRVVATAGEIRDGAIASLTEAGTGGLAVANPAIHPRVLTVVAPDGMATGGFPTSVMQKIEGGVLLHDPTRRLGAFEVAVPGTSKGTSGRAEGDVTAKRSGKGFVIENDLVHVAIGADGTLHHVFDKSADRDALSDRGNQLWSYVDRPRAWDAWDIDETYENAGFELTDVESIEIIESGPLRAAVRVTRAWRDSRFVQTYRLLSGSARIDIETTIDWHERMMLIRALFPTSVHTHEATFETIFGVHKRPTHRNTSWERARFEVSAHRFVDLSEPAYGVAVLNDGKYGHSVVGGTIGLSLVRGPLAPDPFADEGEHRFTYSLLPHVGDWIDAGVVHEAHALNAPLIAVPVANDARGVPALVANAGVDLGFGALKQAHDRDGLVLRLYEPHGIGGRSVLTFSRDVRSATAVTLLEEDADSPLEHEGRTVTLRVRPFEVISILLEI